MVARVLFAHHPGLSRLAGLATAAVTAGPLLAGWPALTAACLFGAAGGGFLGAILLERLGGAHMYAVFGALMLAATSMPGTRVSDTPTCAATSPSAVCSSRTS